MIIQSSTASIPWSTLAQSIADGEAVLIMGPDALPLYPISQAEEVATQEDITFGSLSRKLIRESTDIHVGFFYEQDGLFLFQDERSKNQARKMVRDLARDERWLPDEELLRQIVAMPFEVVLCLSPDQRVREAFERYAVKSQFDFCTPYRKDSVPDIQEPSRHAPLIFNLCGNVLDKRDSPILDYFDLFQLFIKLLGNSGEIPTWLGRKLQEADTYILLGVQLERWYFQLFLHYLNWLDNNAYTNANQNFPFLTSLSEDTQAFVLSQFNIRHVAPTRTDFTRLYESCAEKGILRELHDPLSPGAAQIRILVSQGKDEAAFDLLEKHLDEQERQVDLPHLRARYNAWKQKSASKIVDSRDLDLEINRIRHALLTYASQLHADA